MRWLLTLVFASLLILPVTAITHDRDEHCIEIDDAFLRDCDVDWDDESGMLTITSEEDEDQVVTISKKYVLTVNGEKVDLDKKQKALVKDYYKKMKKLHIMAAEIGEEAAKLGEWAGQIAADAIREVCARILDADDEVRLEKIGKEVEEEAEEIERAAEKIEEKGEELEEVAEDLKDLHYEMKRAVPELDRLEWF